jgi:hypothetical protein
MGKVRQLALALTDGATEKQSEGMRPPLVRCDVCKVLAPVLSPILTIHGWKNVCDSPGCDYGY